MSEHQKCFILTSDVYTDDIINIQIYHLIANDQLFYAFFLIVQDKYICVRNVQRVFPLDEERSILWVACIDFQYEEAKFLLKFINYDIK